MALMALQLMRETILFLMPVRQEWMLVSDYFAHQVERPWFSLGTHGLRGVGQPMEVFTLENGAE